MKKILFAASEAVPFMKTGGLADVTGSLPKYFDKKNYDVRVILPKYVCMEERWKGQLHFLCHFYVNLSWRKQYVGILKQRMMELLTIWSTMNFILREMHRTTIFMRTWRSSHSFQKQC